MSLKKMVSKPRFLSKVLYLSAHRPLSFLKNPLFEYAKDYEIVALIREPVAWWKSWVNYNYSLKRVCALMETTMFSDWNARLEIDETIQNGIDLPEFFKVPQNLERLHKNFLKSPKNAHLWAYIGNIHSLTPTYFKNKAPTIYQFYVNSMIDERVKVFRYEDQFQEFLDYVELPKPPRYNITQYKFDISNEIQDLIKEKERPIYEKYYPELL
jgi:hypothetical protein